MIARRFAGFFSSLLVVTLAVSARAQSEIHAVAPSKRIATGTETLRKSLADRLDVGVRSLHVRLRKDTKGEPFHDSFIGSIDTLDPVQNHWRPIRFFVRYTIAPYVGLGFQTDRLEIRTLTTYHIRNNSEGRDTDGNAIMTGLMPYLFLKYPEHPILEPFAEIGYAFYRNTFEPNEEWYADGRRNFFLENARAPFYALGLTVKAHPRCVVELYFRSVDVNVDGLYVHRYIPEDEPFTFSMHHYAYGLGCAYRF
jgi:hypothetical protein